MFGLLMSIVAGMAMSIQGVMNTRLSQRIGLYASNAFVQATAFVLSALTLLIMGGNLKALPSVPKVYWLGGAIGLVITLSVMVGIHRLGTTVAISIILISQLLTAALIDAFGVLGTEKAPFHWGKYAGLALMIVGVLLFRRDPRT